MPSINPLLVPTIAAGRLFDALSSGTTTLPIRWLAATEPAHYSVLNRPTADVAVRQLVLAKAIDNLSMTLNRSAAFPFLIQPRVASGSAEVDLPNGLLWDMHLSLPAKWNNVRLAKIKRLSGQNAGGTNGLQYDGKLRFIFTSTQNGSSIETAIAYADCEIDDARTYQIVKLQAVDSSEETTAISASESQTVTGTIIFQTIDVSINANVDFLEAVAPPEAPTTGSDGLFTSPAIYELVDSIPGDASGDFATTTTSHGTGMLAASAICSTPALDSDAQTWINAFNYPFRADANLTSTDGIVIPTGLFLEFDMTAPAGDEPSGDASGTYYPVWISRVERQDDSATTLRLYFATYNVTDSVTGGTPSTEAVEFAALDLVRSMGSGDVVEIVPLMDLQLKNSANWQQHMGRGHVVLSNLWDGTSSDVADFFDAFLTITDSPADTAYTKTSTIIGSFGLSRVPKYVPTIGQARALQGSTSRLATPIYPTQDNLYVVEADQGDGDEIDLESESGITPHAAIERYGYSGGLCHRIAYLVVDSSKTGTGSTFYADELLPRLRVLFGRDPQFGDFWWDGTRLKFHNGNTWVG